MKMVKAELNLFRANQKNCRRLSLRLKRVEEMNHRSENEIDNLQEEVECLADERTELLRKLKTQKKSIIKSAGSENDYSYLEEESLSSFSNDAGEEIQNLHPDTNTLISNDDNSQVDNNLIRNHAREVLIRANSIFEKLENGQSGTSRPILPIYGREGNVIEFSSKKQEQSTHLRENEEYADSQNTSPSNKAEKCACSCANSIFSGNAAHVDFFLPRLGLACKCTDRIETIRDKYDASSLSHILRPWQVNFLKSMGITTVEQLILERKQYSRRLAKAMIQWRADKKMKPVKLKSCFVALHIWTRTAKATMKAKRRHQISESNSLSIGENCGISTSESASISTLASTIMSESDEVMEI